MNNINDVEKFKGKSVGIERTNLTEMDNVDSFYAHDIQQCDVICDGKVMGKVHKIVPTGSYDLWYIKRAGKSDMLLPFKDEFVKKIDLQAKEIYVELLPGMDDLNAKK